MPLTPGTRQDLERKGAVCTPNPTGPVLCTWSDEGSRCSMTFDATDELTRLVCEVGGLDYECTRPSGAYACRWSDDGDCGDVYDARGVFLSYACGGDLESILGRACPDGSPSCTPGAERPPSPRCADESDAEERCETGETPRDDEGQDREEDSEDDDLPEGSDQPSCNNTLRRCPTQASTSANPVDCSNVDARIVHERDLEPFLGCTTLRSLEVFDYAGCFELAHLTRVSEHVRVGTSSTSTSPSQRTTGVVLPRLERVGGDFSVTNSVGLTHVSAPRLTSAGGGVNFSYHANLCSVDLSSLEDADVHIGYTEALFAVQLPRLTSAGTLWVHTNAYLALLHAPSLASVGRVITFFNNPNLSHVDLSGLSRIGFSDPLDGGLHFDHNPWLQTVDARSLEEISGSLWLTRHPRLEDFAVLGLRRVNGYVHIALNDSLCIESTLPWENLTSGNVTIDEAPACSAR